MLRNKPLPKHSAPNQWQKPQSIIPASLLTFNFFSARAACLQMGCHTSEPKGPAKQRRLRPFLPACFLVILTSVSSLGSSCALCSRREAPRRPRLCSYIDSTTHTLSTCPHPTHSSRSRFHAASACKLAYLAAGRDFSLLWDPSFFVSLLTHTTSHHSSLRIRYPN